MNQEILQSRIAMMKRELNLFEAQEKGGEIMAGRKYEKDRSKVHKTSVVVAVSQQEKNKILREAERLGMTMSAYIRYRLFIKEAK